MHQGPMKQQYTQLDTPPNADMANKSTTVSPAICNVDDWRTQLDPCVCVCACAHMLVEAL